jgi:dTDP-L-rhamnose 4-epimerase
MKRQDWEARNAAGDELEPAPTPETKRPVLASNYALSKYAQEQMSLIVGQAYRIPTVALRFFNVYGPRQSLSNPYTGVLAIFASRLLNGKPPIIYEDGRQQRDFVSVHDIALACRMALESPEAPGHVLNVGSGRRYSILDIARRLALVMGRDDVQARISGEYRIGDIRHCYADISLAHRVLGYQPRVAFQDGMAELARWLRGQVAVDRVEQAHAELNARGLTV